MKLAQQSKEFRLKWATELLASRRSSAHVTVVSDTGTKLREVIETKINRKLTCTDCIDYLMRLNTQHSHDHAEIVDYLSAQFPWPHWWREKNTRRRAAISTLISPIVPPPAGLTYD